MWMTARKYIENWIVWLVVDVVSTGHLSLQRSRDVRAAVLRLHRHGIRGVVGVASVDAANRGRLTVAIVGAECAGKTTLAAALARGSRAVGAGIRARLSGPSWRIDAADVLAIARGQQRAEDAATSAERPRLRRHRSGRHQGLVGRSLRRRRRSGSTPRWMRLLAGDRAAGLSAADARHSVDTRPAARTPERAARIARPLQKTARRSRRAISRGIRIASAAPGCSVGRRSPLAQPLISFSASALRCNCASISRRRFPDASWASAHAYSRRK